MRYFLSLRTASFLITGCPFDKSAFVFHSVTTAKLPPVRKAVTIASLSLAASSASSILSALEAFTRKYRAPDSSVRTPLWRLTRSRFLAGGLDSLTATSGVNVAIRDRSFLQTDSRPGDPPEPTGRAASSLKHA